MSVPGQRLHGRLVHRPGLGPAVKEEERRTRASLDQVKGGAVHLDVTMAQLDGFTHAMRVGAVGLRATYRDHGCLSLNFLNSRYVTEITLLPIQDDRGRCRCPGCVGRELVGASGV